MKPSDLIGVARILLKSSHGKPPQAVLRRAASTTYYVLFHALARTCADLLVGGAGAQRSEMAWRQVYRALEHGRTKDACKKGDMLHKFPQSIEDFGNTFVMMQEKRRSADYDPHEKFSKSSVTADLAVVEKVLDDFNRAPAKDRRAFAAYVLFRQRQ